MRRYNNRESYLMDMQASHNSGKAEGKAEGVAETKLMIVKNMLAHGLSSDLIKKIAALDDNQLAEIKLQLQH